MSNFPTYMMDDVQRCGHNHVFVVNSGEIKGCPLCKKKYHESRQKKAETPDNSNGFRRTMKGFALSQKYREG